MLSGMELEHMQCDELLDLIRSNTLNFASQYDAETGNIELRTQLGEELLKCIKDNQVLLYLWISTNDARVCVDTQNHEHVPTTLPNGDRYTTCIDCERMRKTMI
jgi:hypothetical protein